MLTEFLGVKLDFQKKILWTGVLHVPSGVLITRVRNSLLKQILVVLTCPVRE